jgi:hypothetical protein
MVELALGTQYQFDSMVGMASSTDVLKYPMPTLSLANIASVSPRPRVPPKIGVTETPRLKQYSIFFVFCFNFRTALETYKGDNVVLVGLNDFPFPLPAHEALPAVAGTVVTDVIVESAIVDLSVVSFTLVFSMAFFFYCLKVCIDSQAADTFYTAHACLALLCVLVMLLYLRELFNGSIQRAIFQLKFPGDHFAALWKYNKEAQDTCFYHFSTDSNKKVIQ